MVVLVMVFLVLLELNEGFDEILKDRVRKNPEAKPPRWLPITQPLDHFDPLNQDLFVMRSLYNDQFFQSGGPIITYIGGEWEISDFGVMGGVAFQLAKKHQGFLFYPEHRFFGKSFPRNYTQPFTLEQLRYLTIEQALGDLVDAHHHLKETIKGLENSQVVLIGGSYSGALAVWGRLKYPDTFTMSYACGGVTKTTVINEDYYNVIFQSFQKQGEYCSKFLKEGFRVVRELLNSKSDHGKLHLQKLFCPKETDLNPRIILQKMLLNVNSQLWFPDEWKNLCAYVKNNTKGPTIERFLDVLTRTSTHKQKTGYCTKETQFDQQWYWLVCTGLGNLQVTSQENFGYITTPRELLEEKCTKKFGDKFNYGYLQKMNKRHRNMLGGSTPDASRILMVQGTHDPWYPRAITDDVNDQIRVIYIEGASHCSEIGETQGNDPARIIKVKVEILDILSGWLN